MAMLNSFCGCLSLKMGSVVAAGYSILLGFMAMVHGVWELTGGLDASMEAAKSQLSVKYPTLSEEKLDDIIQESLSLEKFVDIIVIVLFAIWIVTGLLVFVAVTKKRRCFLMPWIVFTSIMTGFLMLGCIQFIRDAATDHSYLYHLLVVGIVITGNIYGLFGMVSHYQNRCKETKEFTDVDQFAYTKCPDEEI